MTIMRPVQRARRAHSYLLVLTKRGGGLVVIVLPDPRPSANDGGVDLAVAVSS